MGNWIFSFVGKISVLQGCTDLLREVHISRHTARNMFLHTPVCRTCTPCFPRLKDQSLEVYSEELVLRLVFQNRSDDKTNLHPHSTFPFRWSWGLLKPVFNHHELTNCDIFFAAEKIKLFTQSWTLQQNATVCLHRSFERDFCFVFHMRLTARNIPRCQKILQIWKFGVWNGPGNLESRTPCSFQETKNTVNFHV